MQPSRVADTAQTFENVCCLCAPLLGAELNRREKPCRILDIDERFQAFAGYETYDLSVCDPLFWKVPLSQLFAAVRCWRATIGRSRC